VSGEGAKMSNDNSKVLLIDDRLRRNPGAKP
jgi:hypothetical protein